MSKQAKAQEKKQQEYNKQVQNRAMKTLNQLVSQFYENFMANDPESEAVRVTRNQVIAKWKMYCHQNNLLETAFTLCNENCQKIVDKYNEQLKDMENLVTQFDLTGEISDKPIGVLKSEGE